MSAQAQRGQWSSQFGFIIAAIGSAVGLGNVWRFPGVAYDNGGGAFILPYIIALFTAGIPILFLEYAIGHRFRGSAPLALRRIAGKPGETLGWVQVLICVFISLYYTAVIAWTASYFYFSFTGAWEKSESASSFFTADYLHLADAPFTLDFVPGVMWPMIGIWVLVLALMSLGVVKGVQRTNVVMIPVLLVSFFTLVVGALLLPGAFDGLRELFTPNFEALTTPKVWLAAYGQIFFSLSLATGIMITYSSYQRKRANISGSGLVVAFSNSAFELLAGICVFAALGFFASQQHTSISELQGLTGAGLAFMTFPAVVSEMPLSPFFGALFFGSLFMAGLTSLLSILEVVISSIVDKFAIKRTVVIWGVGLPIAAVSVTLFSTTSGLIALDTVDHFSNQIGIVGSAIITAVLVLWVQRRGSELARHVSLISTFKLSKIWLFITSVFAPAVMLAMLVGLPDLVYRGIWLGLYRFCLGCGAADDACAVARTPGAVCAVADYRKHRAACRLQQRCSDC